MKKGRMAWPETKEWGEQSCVIRGGPDCGARSGTNNYLIIRAAIATSTFLSFVQIIINHTEKTFSSML